MKRKNRLLPALLLFVLLSVMLPSAVFAAKKVTPGTVTLNRISALAYNKINIQWKKTSNATHYKIYYKKAGAQKWTGIATVSANATSYTHTSSKSRPITVGQKYVYTVKGYNSRYKTSGKYNAKGLTAWTKPSTVKLNRAALSSDKKKATVSWNKAAGCNYYCVFRKTPTTGWKRLANLSSKYTSYTDKSPVKGQKNIYTVRSYYSGTRIYGNYDSRGVSVTLPAAHKHSYKSVVVEQPTCGEEGIRRYSCSCGKSYTEPIAATGKHIWKDEGTEKGMDWTFSPDGGADKDGPTSTVDCRIASIYTCVPCGKYLGFYGIKDDIWMERYWEHVYDGSCERAGNYTTAYVNAKYHFLWCTRCGKYKRGKFGYYCYETPINLNDLQEFKMLPWQVEELKLWMDIHKK